MERLFLTGVPIRQLKNQVFSRSLIRGAAALQASNDIDMESKIYVNTRDGKKGLVSFG